MPVPSSGELELRGDIALEVYGNATGNNISLGAMSDLAGFASPDAMTDFYGYSSLVSPSVTTNAMSVGETTATLSGNVTSDGGAAITERGFYFGTISASPTNNTKYTVSGTTGSYTNNRTGLSTTTTYYCWAFATNTEGTTYGARVQATTFAVFVPSYENIGAVSSSFYTNLRAYNVYNGSLDAVYRLQYLNPNTGSYIEYQTQPLSLDGYGSKEYYQNNNSNFRFGQTLCVNATNRFYRDVNLTAGASGGLYVSNTYWTRANSRTYQNLTASTGIPSTNIYFTGGVTLVNNFTWEIPAQPINNYYQISFNYN